MRLCVEFGFSRKLAVGYLLDELKNDITRETPASFEPSIDYAITKIPRFAFEKFPQAACVKARRLEVASRFLRWSNAGVISKHLSRLAALLLAFLAVVATAAPLPEVRLLRAPDGGLQPQAIEDAKGALHLIYLKGEPGACDVFYVVRAAGQTNFSAPLRVNRRPGSAVALGTIRGAQLALGRNGRVHVAWNGSVKSKTDSVKSSPMCYARLDDAGNAFEPERNLITTTAALDGGGSVAADEKGNVFVVWHAFPAGAEVEDESHRAVFIARSTDDGKTFAPERPVSPKSTGACGCCGLKAFADSHGRVGVLYRAATGGTERDATLLMSRDAGNTFTNLVVGPWHLTACPMSSMALAQGFGDSWLAAWETAGQIQVGAVMPSLWSCGVSEPEGKGKRKYPVVAVSENHGRRQLTAWVEDAGWARGGPLVWELTDFETTQKSSGRVAGVPVWSLITAVANKDGGFTIIY